MPTVREKRLVLTAGQGAWLTSSTGQRLLDATAGLGHANVGHGRERIARAAYDQMTTLETYHTFGRFANEPALRLAERVVEMGPIPGSAKPSTTAPSSPTPSRAEAATRAACPKPNRRLHKEGEQ